MPNDAVGFGATLNRLWAVALLTFKEAIRRRIFVIVLLFAVALIGSAPFLPAMTPESRLRLIEVWSVRAAFVFSLVLAVFLAGFSLTGDVETRRIYTIVTKPIHKVTILLGKYLGFLLMIAAFLGSTGVVTLLYLRIIAATTKDFPALRCEPRFYPTQHLPLPLLVMKDGSRLEGKVTETEKAYVVETASGPRTVPKDLVKEVADRPVSSIYVTNGYANPEIGAVKIVGGEEPRGVILWQYRGLDASAFEPAVKGRIKLDLGRTGQAYELQGAIVLTVRNPTTGTTWTAGPKTVSTNKEENWTFPREMIDANGAVDIELTTEDPGLSVIAKSDRVAKGATAPRSMALFGRSELFEYTYFKGLVLVLFQSAVVLAMTLSATTLLTAPVSILLGIFVFMLGWTWPFLAESVADVDVELEQFRHGHHEGDGHDHGPKTLAPPVIMKISSWVSKVMLRVVPNFDLFNMSDYLLKDFAVMGRDVWQGFLAMLPRVAVLLLLGVAAMWTRDFSG